MLIVLCEMAAFFAESQLNRIEFDFIFFEIQGGGHPETMPPIVIKTITRRWVAPSDHLVAYKMQTPSRCAE